LPKIYTTAYVQEDLASDRAVGVMGLESYYITATTTTITPSHVTAIGRQQNDSNEAPEL